MAEGQKSASRAGFLIATRPSSLCLTASVVVIPSAAVGSAESPDVAYQDLGADTIGDGWCNSRYRTSALAKALTVFSAHSP